MTKNYVIAISGPPGAGTSTIAREIAKRLGLEYFSPGRVYKDMSDKKEETLAAFELWKTDKGKSKELHNYIDHLQKEKAKKGNIIIDGKISIKMLEKYATHKIWIDAPLEVRVDRALERIKLSPGTEEYEKKKAEIKKNIEERQELERENWKKIYNFDYFEQKNLEGVIFIDNNKSKSVEDVVGEIIEKIK